MRSKVLFLDANIVWTEPEGFPYVGTYRGPFGDFKERMLTACAT